MFVIVLGKMELPADRQQDPGGIITLWYQKRDGDKSLI